METPMVKDLKKLRNSFSDLVDLPLYRQLIGSLMCLENTRSNIFFVVNTLSQLQMIERVLLVYVSVWALL
jgi:hypothetical protein